MALTEEQRREALDTAIVAFEEMGGGAALRVELEAFQNLRLLVCAKYPQLQQEYPNQWIAMNEDGVVAFGESHDAVMAAIRHSRLPCLAIDVITSRVFGLHVLRESERRHYT